MSGFTIGTIALILVLVHAHLRIVQTRPHNANDVELEFRTNHSPHTFQKICSIKHPDALLVLIVNSVVKRHVTYIVNAVSVRAIHKQVFHNFIEP